MSRKRSQAKRPTLLAAVFCDGEVKRQEGLTLVNICHAVHLGGVPPYPATLALVLFSTEEPWTTEIEVRTAAALDLPPIRLPMVVGQEGQTSLATLQIPMWPKEAGTYWFEVFLGGELLARVPFTFLP